MATHCFEFFMFYRKTFRRGNFHAPTGGPNRCPTGRTWPCYGVTRRFCNTVYESFEFYTGFRGFQRLLFVIGDNSVNRNSSKNRLHPNACCIADCGCRTNNNSSRKIVAITRDIWTSPARPYMKLRGEKRTFVFLQTDSEYDTCRTRKDAAEFKETQNWAISYIFFLRINYFNAIQFACVNARYSSYGITVSERR